MSIIFCGNDITLDREAKFIFIKMICTVTRGMNLITDVFWHSIWARSGTRGWVWPGSGDVEGAATLGKEQLSLATAKPMW